MPQFDDETTARAKALIKELVEAGLLPKSATTEDYLSVWKIVSKHIALAEGKSIVDRATIIVTPVVHD